MAGVHGVTSLAMGGAHTIALRQTHDLLAWGANQNGVLGLGIGISQDARTPMKVPKLTCSQVHTLTRHAYLLNCTSCLICPMELHQLQLKQTWYQACFCTRAYDIGPVPFWSGSIALGPRDACPDVLQCSHS